MIFAKTGQKGKDRLWFQKYVQRYISRSNSSVTWMKLSDYSNIQVNLVNNISDYHLRQKISDFRENGTERKRWLRLWSQKYVQRYIYRSNSIYITRQLYIYTGRDTIMCRLLATPVKHLSVVVRFSKFFFCWKGIQKTCGMVCRFFYLGAFTPL